MKRIVAPRSKSYEHRFLICEFLSKLDEVNCVEDTKDQSKLINEKNEAVENDAEDIIATKNCLYEIEQSLKNGNQKALLDCNQSGSSLRFLLPIVCALGLKADFIMRGRLAKRPLDSLLNELIAHGCKIDVSNDVLSTERKLKHGVFNLPGNISSQYVSGLLMAMPLLSADSEIHVKKPLFSAPYIDITLDVLRDFSISVSEENHDTEHIYRVKGGQRYILPKEYVVEGDWSNAGFWFAAGILGDEPLVIEGLNPCSLQGDRKIVEILKKMGADLRFVTDNGKPVFEAYPIGDKVLKSIEIDAGNIPDLVPLIALLCCLADGKSKISGIKRLRLKESDRVAAIENLIGRLGGSIAVSEDTIEIDGIGKEGRLKGGKVTCFDDHRIVMTAAIASLRCEKKLLIDNAKAVNKSYVSFFDEFDRIGLSGNCLRK